MYGYEYTDHVRENLQTQLFQKGIYKIGGRHIYECSLDEMNVALHQQLGALNEPLSMEK